MRTPEKPSVLVYGYYGYGNPGDEAVCRILVEKLLARWPEADICVMTADPERTSLMRGLRTRPKSIRVQPLSLLRCLARVDALVFGGGTLIEGRFFTLLPIVFLSTLAKILGTRVIFYGQGAEYLDRLWHRLLIYPALKAVTLATVRDRQSRSVLARMGLSSEKICLAADEAANLDLQSVDIPAAPYIAVCPKYGVSLNDLSDERLATAMANMGDAIVQRFRHPLVLVPFQSAGVCPDIALCRMIQAAMHEKSTILNTNSMTPRQIKSILANALGCVTMPLHAAIFAATSGTPVVGLSYAAKVDNFFNEIGLGRFVTSDVSTVCDLLNEAIACKPSELVNGSLTAYKHRVPLNFLGLEAVLCKHACSPGLD